MRDVLEKILSLQAVDIHESERLFSDMLDGKLTAAQTSAYLVALRSKGEDFNDLTAGAEALRARAARPAIAQTLRPLADNCGTGGDGSGSFNISTTAAIVAASLGLRIAKHGNRSISSKCGSADLLFKAGYPENISTDQTALLLENTGFTFFFAPNFHPAMKHVGPIRRELGIRTIFNLLGPLANPIAPEIQLIGVGANHYLKPIAQAAAQIGIKTALIVHSRDGMDEISPSAITDCVLARNGSLTEFVVDPQTLGISGTHDISGGDAEENHNILRRLLDGSGTPYIEAVAINAGALLWISDLCAELADGYNMAKKQISSGNVKNFFDGWIASAQSISGKSDE